MMYLTKQTLLQLNLSTKRVGIFQDTPLHTLDVTGDMRVTGNLIVEGNSASIDVATLRVEDKQIELAIECRGRIKSRWC